MKQKENDLTQTSKENHGIEEKTKNPQTKESKPINKNRKLIYRNQDYDCSSHMINKFNNKTYDILDPPKQDPIYSTNLN